MSEVTDLEHSLREGLGVSGDDSYPKFLEAIAIQLGAPHEPSLQATIAQSTKDIVEALNDIEMAIRGES